MPTETTSRHTDEDGKEGVAPLIKSRDPHLAGGDTHLVQSTCCLNTHMAETSSIRMMQFMQGWEARIRTANTTHRLVPMLCVCSCPSSKLVAPTRLKTMIQPLKNDLGKSSCPRQSSPVSHYWRLHLTRSHKSTIPRNPSSSGSLISLGASSSQSWLVIWLNVTELHQPEI